MKKNLLFKYLVSLVLSLCMILMTACGNGLSIPDEYNYDDFSDFIKLSDYKNIEYTPVEVNVSQDDIDEYISDELYKKATDTIKVTSGVAKKNSIANIDYVGSIDGVEFEGGSGKNYDLNLADSTFISGFAEEIVGHSVGETFDVNVTFPKDYASKTLAGKPAVFVTTINYLTEKVIPEYNLDYVKKNTDFDNIEDYENSVKELVTDEKEKQADIDNRKTVFNNIIKSSKVIEYPSKEYKTRLESISDEKQTKLQVKNELVLYAIAKDEGIKITNTNYKKYVENILNESGISVDDFETQIGIPLSEYAEQNGWFFSFLYEEVMDKVMLYLDEK